MRFHCISIFEQIVAQIQEALLEVTCVKVLRRDAVVNEFPYILGEAAAQIEKCMLRLRFFEEREDARVGRLKTYGEVEEPEQAEARIWFGVPCPFSLCAGQ